ncbi:S24 family peptidase, partial [Psychromonas sp.]|nr:S24 family peptidase [Psychromonas sp.]
LGSGSVQETLAKYKEPTLSEGCYINYDLEITEFWEVLAKQQRTNALEDYQALYEQLGHRPTASEFFLAYGDLKKVNKQYGSWVEFIIEVEKHNITHQLLDEHLAFIASAVQTTSMSKSFKAILLKAFLRLDGFAKTPSLEALSAESYRVLKRYPHLFETELPSKERQSEANSKVWLSYWKRNPIKAFTTANKNTKTWFSIIDNKFVANIQIAENNKDHFEHWVQELLDLRLLAYRHRDTVKKSIEDLSETFIEANSNVESNDDNDTENNVIQLVFYPDIKIACGHFKTGDSSQVEYRGAPEGHGHLDPKRHFLAYATGHSMNGGKHPIQDGDLLLLELITPDSAGSLQGQTIVIENHEITGDEQYLLRDVKKLHDGRYQLIAKNSDYQPIIVSEEMKPLARLKAVVS